MKKFISHFFIDGLNGMVLGLFSTLIIGTILQQLGSLIGGDLGNSFFYIGKLASILTGAGIGCGVAYKLQAKPLVLLSGAVSGMIGAYASSICAGTLLKDGTILLPDSGEPLGAFLAAFLAVEIGSLIAGKTQMDLVVTPFVSIGCGAITGIFLSPFISQLMYTLSDLLLWSTEQQPFLMGVLISVLMGIFCTLPVNSVALAMLLPLKGLAAGAACVGCCTHMIGFAVSSYKENGASGLLAQGFGTSMLQFPNALKRPLICLPVVLTSAILGPVSTCLIKMSCNSTGAGFGNTGLIGPIMSYNTMVKSSDTSITLFFVCLMYFVLPGLLSMGISEGMRKLGWIKEGDMHLDT